MSVIISNPSKVFCDFRSIDKYDFHYIVKFYEDTQESDHFIDSEEELIMQYYYALSLFETNELSLFINQADDILSHIFNYNITLIDGQDVLFELLSKKSLAMYHLSKYDTAFSLGHQLHGIYKSADSLAINRALYMNHSLSQRGALSRFSVLLALFVMAMTCIFNLTIIHPATYIVVTALSGFVVYCYVFWKYYKSYTEQVTSPIKTLSQNL